MSSDQSIDRIANKILTSITSGTDRLVVNRTNKIQKGLDALQDTFFTILVQKAIDVDSTPDLGEWTPQWKDLTDDYKSRRKKRGKGFYKYTGALQRGLLLSKATTTFGKPLVSIVGLGSYRGKSIYVYTQSGRVTARNSKGGVVALDKVKNILPRGIMIDLYPKVTESLKKLKIDEGKYFSDRTAFKLANFQGGRDRPLIVHYMNWWLDVKARDVIRKALK